MKFKKQHFTVLSVVLLSLLIIVVIIPSLSVKKEGQKIARAANPSPASTTSPNALGPISVQQKFSLPKGRQTYFIRSGHHSPQIYEATIDPVDVQIGQTQTFRLKVKDSNPANTIQKVVAKTQTDNKLQTLQLNLTSGSKTDGSWSASWNVNDTHSAKYTTTLIAYNQLNESGQVSLAWSDPCSPPAGGDWTLDGNCSISGVNGVDNGNFTINLAYTLTINAAATFVWNPLKSITLSAGSIAVANTGQLKQTYLWMTDADADGYPATTTQIAQDTAPASGRRRNLMSSTTSVDCNDANAAVGAGQSGYIDADGDGYGAGALQSAYCGASAIVANNTDCYDSNANAHPGQLSYFTSSRGDGSFDYDCNGSNDYQIGTWYTETGGCALSHCGASCTGTAAPSCGGSGNYSCTITGGGSNCDCSGGDRTSLTSTTAACR